MKKLGAILLLLCLSSCLAPPARTQNVQCPNRPLGDSTNACANTRFVIQNAGGGGGGTPGGTSGQVQYNNAGAFGGFTLSGDCTIPTIAAGAITCTKLNNVSPGTIWTQNSNNVSITGGTINGAVVTGLAAPSVGSDAVNKTYADSIASGFFPLAPVVAATTTTLPANTYANGASGVGATLTGNANGALAAQDGVTLIATNRLLVKTEAAQANNGCYTLTTVGDGSNPYVLTRCTDFDTAAEMLAGRVFGVTSGTVNGTLNWYNTTTTTTVGTTAVIFAQFSTANYWTLSGSNIFNNTGGNVGVGTSTMPRRFNVESTAQFQAGFLGGTVSGSYRYTSLIIGQAAGGGTASNFGYMTHQSDTSLSGMYLTNFGDGEGTSGVFVKKGGNVGIQNSNPTRALDTTGTVRFQGVATGLAGCVAIDADGDLSRTACGASGGSAIFYPSVICDGVTDNTAAFQSSLTAAAAAGGGIVEYPFGSCLSGTLTISNSVWFRGQWSGSVRAGVNGSTLKAKTGITNLINVTGYNVRISNMTLLGNSTSGWGIANNPGNTGGNSIANPTLVTDTAINAFSQAGTGGIINQSGSINIERNQFNANCFHFYSFDANVSGRFLKNDLEFGGECGWQAIWSRDGGNVNEGQIIRDNQFLGSQGEGVWIKNCLLCWFENNVIGSTSGARDLAITTGDAMHIIGNWGDKNVEIITNERSWYHRNSIRSTGALSISGPWLSMFNIVTTGTCSLGAGVTALINANAACNNTAAVPSTW